MKWSLRSLKIGTRVSWVSSGPKYPSRFNSPERRLGPPQSAQRPGLLLLLLLLGAPTWPAGEPAQVPATARCSHSAPCLSGAFSFLPLPRAAISDYASGGFGPSSASVPDNPSPRVPPPPPSPAAVAASSASGVAGLRVGTSQRGAEVRSPV